MSDEANKEVVLAAVDVATRNAQAAVQLTKTASEALTNRVRILEVQVNALINKNAMLEQRINLMLTKNFNGGPTED